MSSQIKIACFCAFFVCVSGNLLANVASSSQSATSKSASLSSQDVHLHQIAAESNQQNGNISQRTEAEKETRREERNLEREAKEACEISYERRNGKRKKCEPSIYEQALPGVNFDKVDEKVVDDITRELQRNLKPGTRSVTVK